MLFPFRTSTIFRNRWVALLWAAGICFTAAQVVDSISGKTGKSPAETSPSPDPAAANDPVAVAFGTTSTPSSTASGPPAERIAR